MSYNPANVRNVRRWLVDRESGLTAQGLVEVIVLAFTDEHGKQHAFCLSKEDTILVAEQLRLAALNAKAVIDTKLGVNASSG